MDVQEPQPSTSAAVVENKDKDIATEAEWQKPISLKALKKKLNELFVVKWVLCVLFRKRCWISFERFFFIFGILLGFLFRDFADIFGILQYFEVCLYLPSICSFVKFFECSSNWFSFYFSLIFLVSVYFNARCSLSGCCYYFENDEKRILHERCHASMDAEQLRSFKCIECSHESKMWRDCTTHMWKKHKIDIDLLKCPFCSFKEVFSGEPQDPLLLKPYFQFSTIFQQKKVFDLSTHFEPFSFWPVSYFFSESLPPPTSTFRIKRLFMFILPKILRPI